MDGTLVDSERETDAVITEVMARYGLEDVRLPPEQTRGRSWRDIVAFLVSAYGLGAAPSTVERELVDRWCELVEGVSPLPGAKEALREAARHLRVAVVSSSPRSVVETIVARLGASESVTVLVGADDVARHKPDPEPWLHAASELGVEPAACMVVEDASAGLRAARAAGMTSVAVLIASAEPALCRALADASFEHYEALPARFWERLATRGSTVLDELAEETRDPAP